MELDTSSVNSSRRTLLKGTALAAAAGTLAMSQIASAASHNKKTDDMIEAPKEARFWLTNVKLETGFAYDAKKNG